jgi:putative acyl-CoA dehydrogenase
MCLDVLRVLGRSPSAIAVLMDEARDAATSEPRMKKHLNNLEKRAQSVDEGQARALARDLILALQASLLIRYSTPEVAEAFCASRLDGGPMMLGCLPANAETRAIVARASPVLS